MTAGATEAIVEVEMAESRVEIVEPHQAHKPAAKPDTFGIASRSVQNLGGFGEFVGALLSIPGGVGRCRRGIGGRLPALILGS